MCILKDAIDDHYHYAYNHNEHCYIISVSTHFIFAFKIVASELQVLA